MRVGEMERDCLISHGASAVLHERMFLSSDKKQVPICKMCGLIAEPAHNRKFAYGIKGAEPYCRNCNINNCHIKYMPGAQKLLQQELQAETRRSPRERGRHLRGGGERGLRGARALGPRPRGPRLPERALLPRAARGRKKTQDRARGAAGHRRGQRGLARGGDGGRGARLDGRRGPPGPRRRRRRAREAAAGGQEAAWRAPRGVNVFTLTWAVKANFQTTHTMFSPQYAELRSDPLSVGVLECKLRRAAY